MRISLFLIIYFSSFSTIAQLSGTTYDEVINDRLETLEMSGSILLRDLSQKPLSLWKMKQLFDSVGVTDNEGHRDAFSNEIEYFEPSKGWSVNWLENLSVGTMVQDLPRRPIAKNGIDERTEAFNQPVYFPFADRRFQKSVMAFETGHRLTYKNRFEIYARPQFTFAMNRNESSSLRFKNLFMRTQVRNLEFQLGRDEIMWDISNSGADLFGNSAPTFDMLKIITPNAFRLPWFLKHIGQFKFSTFFAYQGKYDSKIKALMSAYRLDYQFFKRWNLTVEHSFQIGGGDIEWPNFKDFLAEYVGFLLKAGNPKPSDHNIAFSPSYTGDNFKAYFSVNIEDTDRQWKLLFWRNAMWKAGFVKYGIGNNKNLFSRFEVVKSGPRQFKHGIYNNPALMSPALLNFTIGPDAFSFTSEVGLWMNQKKDLFKGQAQFYFRSSDVWQIIREGSDFVDISRTENSPEEYHYILKAKYFRSITDNLNFVGKAGLDFVQNSNFVVGNSDFNYLVSAEIIYRPFFRR